MGQLHSAFKCFEGDGDAWDAQHASIDKPYPGHEQLGAPAHRMDLPLSAYFISSGHNSYLTGNQLTDESGTTTIENCLKRGCRVIELDVYNKQGGFSGPVCKHGGTLTAPVSFQACIQAVKDNAFLASPYPAIITLENHTDEENQVMMADILSRVLGDALYVPQPEEVGQLWKSPEALRGKVLIRANASKSSPALKRLVYISNTKFTSLADANASGKTSSSSFDEAKAKKLLKKALASSGLALGQAQEHRLSSSGRTSSLGGSRRVAAPSTEASPQPDKGLAKAAQAVKDKEEAVASAVGHAIEKPADELPEEVVANVGSLAEVYTYTSHNLMRVYPGGLRVDSSNYDPTVAWAAGASLAALNWQSRDDQPLWINKALVRRNEA